MFPAFPHAHFHSEPSGAADVPEAALPPSHTLRGQHRKEPQCPGVALMLNCTGDYPVVVWGFLN